MRARKKDSTTHPVPFFVTSTADHITGKTGLTPTVTISKDGSTSFGAVAGAVTEMGSGWYALAGSSSDRNTLGTAVFHVAPSSCDPADFSISILAIDPFDANLGLTNLDATISSRAAAGTTVTFSGPVISTGVLAVVPGDDYYAADSRSYDPTYSGVPSLTGASSISLAVRLQGGGTNVFTATGSVLSSTQLRFEFTSAQTAQLAQDSTYDYQVQVLLSGTSHVTTLEEGTLTTNLNLVTP